MTNVLEKQRALEILTGLVNRGAPLGGGDDAEAVTLWADGVRVALRNVFGDEHERVKAFDQIEFVPMMVRETHDPGRWAMFEVQARSQGVHDACTLLAACISEITTVWPDAPEGPPPDWNALARRFLKTLYDAYLERGALNWSYSPAADDGDFTVEQQRKAMANVVSRDLAKWRGNGACVIEQYGIDVCENPERLDDVLPLRDKSRATRARDGEPRIDVSTLTKLVVVRDDALRAVITRDLDELRGVNDGGHDKSVMLLAGSVLEGVLIDLLQRRSDLAQAFLPKTTFPDAWSLDQLLDAASSDQLAIGVPALLTSSAKADGEHVTDHRDLIHPHRCVRENVVVDDATAALMLVRLWRVLKDIQAAYANGNVTKYEEA